MQLVQGSLLAHPLVIAWRNRLRGNVLLKSAYRFWSGSNAYEERFGREMLTAIRPADVVWDIGANVGLYSEQFLARGAGQVVCFEPAPAAVQALEARLGGEHLRKHVRIVPAALSDRRGIVQFVADGASPVNRIADAPGNGSIEVPVLRGDEAMVDLKLPTPDIIKIDVEGYELEVIEGLTRVLESANLRAVFIEVHFALLHARGHDHAPSRIVERLRAAGFRTHWLDASHICALRAGARHG